MGSSARSARMAAQERRGRLGAVLRRARRLQAPRSGERRSSDPALRVPDQLHALSARDRAGHAAVSVRVPDPGRAADRHGGRQRLDVRRLDRRGRGGADGASRHPAEEGGARRAACIRTIARRSRDRLGACPGDAVVRLPPALAGRARTSSRRSTSETSCVVVQTPDVFGNLHDLRPIAESGAREGGAADRGRSPRSCRSALVEPPGEMGADIVVGEGQSIGNGLNFGGPYVGLFAAAMKYLRQMPGRLVRRDRRRRRAARLRADALDARAAHPPREGDDQHLHQFGPLRARLQHPPVAARRDGAASARAHQSRQRRRAGRAALAVPGVEVLNETFFNEFTIRMPRRAAA